MAAVSDESSPSYVPPADRVATFDNDGTLWCEKPAYIQLFFAIERLKQVAEADPGLLEKPVFKAAAAGDMGYFAGLYPHDSRRYRLTTLMSSSLIPRRIISLEAPFQSSLRRTRRWHRGRP